MGHMGAGKAPPNRAEKPDANNPPPAVVVPFARGSKIPLSCEAEVLRLRAEGASLSDIAQRLKEQLNLTFSTEAVARFMETCRQNAEKQLQRPQHEVMAEEVEDINFDLRCMRSVINDLNEQLSDPTLLAEERKRLDAEHTRRLKFYRVLISNLNAVRPHARRPKNEDVEEPKPVDPRAAEKELTERPIKLEEGGPEMPKVMVLHSGAEGPAIDWFTEFTTRNITFEPCKHPEPFPEWAETIDEDDALALFVDLSNSRAPLDWLKVLLDVHPALEPRLVFAVGPETPPALREEMELFRHPDHPIIEFPLERDALAAVTDAVVQATRERDRRPRLAG